MSAVPGEILSIDERINVMTVIIEENGVNAKVLL